LLELYLTYIKTFILSGGLPAVTEAFQRVLRGQKEWGKVGKTIADREGKLADAEWVNTQIFLRYVSRGKIEKRTDRFLRTKVAGWEEREYWLDGS